MLRVLHVAYPFAPVGPRAVGGAEQILGDVDAALVAAGHASAVVACEGSKPVGELFAAPMPPGLLDGADESSRQWWQRQYQRAIDRALASRHFDVIHMHGLDWHAYRLPAQVPVLVTLHMPVAWYPERMWRDRVANVHFQCVSRAQFRACPDTAARVIENGVALPPLDPAVTRGRYALALGRICPEKNLHAALAAGTLAGVPVWVGGQVFPYESHLQYDREWFRPALLGVTAKKTSLEPRLGHGVHHRFLGPLLAKRKQRLLARARCLLHPTLAPETSSLVAMEALAAGTPVIAYRSGALPEVVEDGVTGFLVRDEQEMAEAIGRVSTIRPEACRAAAERRFDVDRMSAEYLRLYAELAETHAVQRHA